MAWLSVNYNGSENISCNCPIREGKGHFASWVDIMINCCNEIDMVIEIPHGTIEKIVGKKITWDDNPVELKI